MAAASPATAGSFASWANVVASTPIGKTPSRTSRAGSCTRSISTVRPRMSVREVVEQRPQDAVGEPLVEPGDLVVAERHADEPHGGQLLVQQGLPLGIEVPRRARPSDPETVGLLVRVHEAGREATGAPLHLH